METLYKKMYDEIVTAGKLIVKMNQFMEENKKISTDFKSEIEETLKFLRNSARYYFIEYKHQMQFKKELENMYQEDMCQNCKENDYNPCTIYDCEKCPHFDICHEYPNEME